jgi:hypothetical protein
MGLHSKNIRLIKKTTLLKFKILAGHPVAHAYNPSHSGGRDQEDHGSKPVWANSSRDSILEKKKKSQK